ncbi:hypothetical protein TWF281_001409 [Arthrobotrys megalospora]
MASRVPGLGSVPLVHDKFYSKFGGIPYDESFGCIDPDLNKYGPPPQNGKSESIRFIQQSPGIRINSNRQSLFFLCGKCDSASGHFTEDMITFQLGELKKFEDLILCSDCHQRFPGLEQWRIRNVFRDNSGFPPGSMIRVLSPRSSHNGEKDYWQLQGDGSKDPRLSDDEIESRRWLIPRFEFVWPLWQFANCSEATMEKNGWFYECILSGKHYTKPSDFIDGIAGHIGRYKSTACTAEEIETERPNKILPVNLFARHDDAKCHIPRAKYRRYHGNIPATHHSNYVERNSQDDISQRGNHVIGQHGFRMPEAMAIPVSDHVVQPAMGLSNQMAHYG